MSKRPWWQGRQWIVKAVSVLDGRTFKRGEWVEIYATKTQAEAKRLAKAWGAKMNTPTLVEPGDGHKSKREQ